LVISALSLSDEWSIPPLNSLMLSPIERLNIGSRFGPKNRSKTTRTITPSAIGLRNIATFFGSYGVSRLATSVDPSSGLKLSPRAADSTKRKGHVVSQRNQSRTRRIVLPSGAELRLHQLNQVEAGDRELHVCPSCGSELVQPTNWSHTVDDRFALTLECPNCTWRESGLYGQAQVELLEDRLDDGVTALIDDLRLLTQANLVSDVDSFVDALNRGLIVPEDF